MYKLGPILIRTSLLQPIIKGVFYWCYIELNDENTVLKFSVAPFLLSDTIMPEKFEIYNAESGVFFVFDPSSESYFSLAITIQHSLIKFRPFNVPLNFKPHIGEVFISGGYTPQFPALKAPSYVTSGYQDLHNELHNNQELLSCIKSQYQNATGCSLWNTEKQDINGVNSISRSTKEALIKNGFLLALNYLKTESKTPLTYCYAVASIITKKNISIILKNKLSAEPSLIEQAEQLTRYMTDTALYDATYPLQQELFDEIKRLYLSEIDKHGKFESGDDVLLALKDENLLSFSEILSDFNAEHSRIHMNTHYSEDTYFLMLTNQIYIPDGIENLQACLLELNHNERVRTALMERFYAHFDDDHFETKLQSLIKRINTRYKHILKCHVKKYIDDGSDSTALCEKLKPIIRESHDVRILLNILDTNERKRALIDALEIHNQDCEIMKNLDDFINFSIDLKHDVLCFLLMKRTPQDWSKFITKFDDLLVFLKIIKTNVNKLLFINGNPTYFAGLINTDSKLLSLFPICNIKQLKILLAEIKPETTQHWFQTPKKLHDLLTLETSSYLMSKVSVVLSSIPPSFRITAIVRLNRASFISANFLISTRANLLKLYWNSLDEADWDLLFSDLNILMRFLFTIMEVMEVSVSGPIILEEFIEEIPQQFKRQILERINEEPDEYNNKKLLGILKKSCTARSQLHEFGLFRANETPPPMEQPSKCARLTYK